MSSTKRKKTLGSKHKITADLSEDNTRINVSFPFSLDTLERIRNIPGSKFKPADKGGPYWHYPKDLEIARALSREFSTKEMRLGKRLRRWAFSIIELEQELLKFSKAEHAELQVLPEVLPELHQSIYLGPIAQEWEDDEREIAFHENEHGSFQTADVAYLAAAIKAGTNPLNGIHPGLGKTLEVIAAIFEAEVDEGSHLVVAPVTSLETVWQLELEAWQPYPVLVATGGSDERDAVLMAAEILQEEGEPFWLVVNPNMVQFKAVYATDDQGHRTKEEEEVYSPFPILHEIEWDTVILDEIHKAGFRNLNSLMARGMTQLKATRKIAMTGTPIGGRPVNLWRILHWLNPDRFTSQWRWAEQWLVIEKEKHQGRTTRTAGDVREELEDEFYKAHAQYFLRRTKEEVLEWLPPKMHVDLWAKMDAKQERQYKQFALEAEVKIGDYELSATSILAEYTRLKQFAIAYQDVELMPDGKIRPKPTFNSCKLEVLEQILNELGIFDGSDEQVVIFSQFTQVVEMVHEWLTTKHHVQAAKLSGKTSAKKRKELVQEFQEFEHGSETAQILVMNVMAGGVSITLDMANTVIFLDETWVPDDQEQAEDRCHRASRIHQVTCYYIRTRKTIEEYIMRRVKGKANVNKMILDLRRRGLRAVKE